jgi:hypothetical protein
MFRKLALALVATGALGLAAFAPTDASAYTSGPHMRGHHHGPAVHRQIKKHPRAHAHHRSCIQKHMVRTPHGPRMRTVNVCR